MQITAVLSEARRRKLAPLQRRLLEYLEAHGDDVYSYRDEELAAAVSIKPSALGFSLWALEKARLIEKTDATGKVLFGSREAIEKLHAGLGRGKRQAFERAWINVERVRARVGNIDSEEILDEVRGGPLQ